MTVGPSIVSTEKIEVNEIIIKTSSNICESVVGTDAIQLYPYSMCQDIPTGLYSRWEFDTDMQKLKAKNNQSHYFEIMVMSFYQVQKPECKAEKKVGCLNSHKLVLP